MTGAVEMDLKLHVWRQSFPDDQGGFETYDASGISPDMSFLEVLDLVNERITREGGEPIAFEHDCREGICGSCGMMINGIPHGPPQLIATCQLHMRSFKHGDEIWIEPWRADAFPVLKDLVVDRSAFDRIIQAGGYVSIRTGSSPEANSIPVPKAEADRAFDAAACIGCGACVAACPNASSMLFTASKAAHLSYLPQGQAERYERAVRMLVAQDEEGFGNCTNHGACQEVCPKGISLNFIARLNRDYITATRRGIGVEREARESKAPES